MIERNGMTELVKIPEIVYYNGIVLLVYFRRMFKENVEPVVL